MADIIDKYSPTEGVNVDLTICVEDGLRLDTLVRFSGQYVIGGSNVEQFKKDLAQLLESHRI